MMHGGGREIDALLDRTATSRAAVAHAAARLVHSAAASSAASSICLLPSWHAHVCIRTQTIMTVHARAGRTG